MEDDVNKSNKEIVKEGFLKELVNEDVFEEDAQEGLTQEEISFKTKRLIDLVNDGDLRHVQEFLAKEEIGVNVQDEQGLTPLMVAALNGRVRLTEELIASKADLNMQDALGETALMKAICNGYNRTAQLLIEAKADLDIQSNKGLTALMRAVHKGDMDILGGLLAHGVDLDLQDCYGLTALMHAVQTGFNDVVLFLIVAGADLDKKDITDKTARDWANAYAHVECLRLLDAIQKEKNHSHQFTDGFQNHPFEETQETQESLTEPKKIMSSKILGKLEQERTREE